MLKRLKVWTYLTVAAGASLYHIGCGGGFMPWGGDWTSLTHTIVAVLNEDIFG